MNFVKNQSIEPRAKFLPAAIVATFSELTSAPANLLAVALTMPANFLNQRKLKNFRKILLGNEFCRWRY
jgi:hypothetical protein